MGLFARTKHTENAPLSEDNADAGIKLSQDREKEAGVYGYDDSPVKFLSMPSLAMGVLVSMGGFIFGYDTGMSLWVDFSDGMSVLTDGCRSNFRFSSDARLSPSFWGGPGQWHL